ncbi:Pyridine nucleotide-disulphide oxidoreductase [Malonomonas rubra DSM 5091]|uniref:Pyridine nucleotide-disulphide oxidoreductase n=1 Tax=Malonomonas rubra DSM 5091 TaxID=1122189 RepID=A0A1M6C2J2_MALRU|nr:FAD-dependent oxidoreductase [Malonomonas rubra]SHI55237.1 Pyridine nucleotide-disulphide oxidoreductase [Malonomonas rubra DSM 5091]
MPEYYDFVVLGNSAAGLQALRTLRKHERNKTIAIIDREDCPAYSRVLTPYYVGGHIGRDGINIVDHAFYQKLGVTTLFGQVAVALNPDGPFIELSDGEKVGFGKLLLAIGAEARTLSVNSEKTTVLRHAADAEKIISLLQGAKAVTAIGAGLVSLPLLSHADDGMEKHLIVGSNRIFSRVVDAEAAAILETALTAKGLQLFKENDVTDIAEGERLTLSLKSGDQLQSDLLIVGKGVQPNTDLAKNAGLQVNDGVCIDRFCRSSHPDIYAAGDVAEGADFISGEATIQGNWMTAVEQGENAALNMLGLETAYEGSLKNNITEIFGIDVAAVGYCQDDAPATACNYNAATRRFRKVFLDEQKRVIGATMIGETNDSGLYYQLVKTRSFYPGEQLLAGTANYAQVQLRLAC